MAKTPDPTPTNIPVDGEAPAARKPLFIIGTGPMARAALQTAQALDLMVYGFLMGMAPEGEGEAPAEIQDIPVLGSLAEHRWQEMLQQRTADFFPAEESLEARRASVQKAYSLEKALPINLIHPSAVVAEDAELQTGILAEPLVSIGPGAEVDALCWLGAGSRIGDAAKLGAGITLRANTVVGPEAVLKDGVYAGAGSIVDAGVSIGKHTRLAAGTVVLRNLEAKQQAFGNPAQTV